MFFKLFILILCLLSFSVYFQGPNFKEIASSPDTVMLGRTLNNIVLNNYQKVKVLERYFSTSNYDACFNKIVRNILNNNVTDYTKKIEILHRVINDMTIYNPNLYLKMKTLNSTRDSLLRLKYSLNGTEVMYSSNTGDWNQVLYVQLPGLGDHVLVVAVNEDNHNTYLVQPFFHISSVIQHKYFTNYFNSSKITEFITTLARLANRGDLDRPSINGAKRMRQNGYIIDLLQ
jgi:hypothetical protein